MARFYLMIEDDEDGETTWRCKLDPLVDEKRETTNAQNFAIQIMEFVKKNLLADQDIQDLLITDSEDEFAEEFQML